MTEDKLYYTVFSVAGDRWIAVAGSAKGLLRSTLPRVSYRAALEQLGDLVEQAAPSPDIFGDIAGRLRKYHEGQPVKFPDKLDLSRATPFQRSVWEETRLIPYGETRSYAWIAARLGRREAARAVGQALGQNPLTVIIPCHRVLASDGSLGGFSDGLEMKRHLLDMETAGFKLL